MSFLSIYERLFIKKSDKMNNAIDKSENLGKRAIIIFSVLILLTCIIYLFSNPEPQKYYDYTFRVAENMLSGKIGITEEPPPWLNEFVPFGGKYYSVFPLGSVLTMLPFALLKLSEIITDMPAAFIYTFTAGCICFFLLLISTRYDHTWARRILMTFGILFGTWMWTNLCFGGAWHLALGFAMLGELGAIYFTIYNRRPLLAGIFFALAFGNRTEVLLTAPIFMFLLSRNSLNFSSPQEPVVEWKALARFCAVPFVLGVLTLIYNFVRFESFVDFGYSRIPGVLNEPWYNHGIFSIYYIPQNFLEMLYTPWKRIAEYPYIVPTGFGGAIWWSSPFLFFLFRFGARDKILKYSAWAAILIMTFLLWIHGNPGGWQFSYRYGMVLLPWMFVILLENSPRKISFFEWVAYFVSIVINAYATYLFLWTDYVKP